MGCNMKILAIDTSCDETAAAVTENEKVLSNIVWSQASLHAKFGGVVPSLAQRQHEERIDWAINKALGTRHLSISKDIDTVAVTVGPGLAIALGVGINKAKELAKKYNKPLIAVNHIEAHLLSSLAKPNRSGSKTNTKYSQEIQFPAHGLVVSGGNTLFVQIDAIGKYKILAQTVDDALGEALDKAARMLGFGYPGAPILEKFAREGDPLAYPLPIPMVGQEKKMVFSYSGLKTAFWRLVEKEKTKGLNKQKIADLAASFQNVAFEHIIRIMDFHIRNSKLEISNLLVGGGVASNKQLRKRLRVLGKKYGIKTNFSYSKKLYTDNAAMIGVCAYLKAQKSEVIVQNLEEVDRKPDLKLVAGPR